MSIEKTFANEKVPNLTMDKSFQQKEREYRNIKGFSTIFSEK